MTELNNIRVLLALGIGIIAAAWDIKYRKIPNWLTFPGMVAGIIINIIGDYHHWSFSLTGLLTGLLLLMLPYALGGIGTGDVKFLMALGAVLGARGVLWTTLYGAVAGGILSVIWMMRRYGVCNALHRLNIFNISFWSPKSHQQTRVTDNAMKLYIPYGLAITIGFICFIVNGPK